MFLGAGHQIFVRWLFDGRNETPMGGKAVARQGHLDWDLEFDLVQLDVVERRAGEAQDAYRSGSGSSQTCEPLRDGRAVGQIGPRGGGFVFNSEFVSLKTLLPFF